MANEYTNIMFILCYCYDFMRLGVGYFDSYLVNITHQERFRSLDHSAHIYHVFYLVFTTIIVYSDFITCETSSDSKVVVKDTNVGRRLAIKSELTISLCFSTNLSITDTFMTRYSKRYFETLATCY